VISFAEPAPAKREMLRPENEERAVNIDAKTFAARSFLQGEQKMKAMNEGNK
jgi:hypothetical protein